MSSCFKFKFSLKRRIKRSIVTLPGKLFFSLCSIFKRKTGKMNFYHSLPVQIRFNDTDPAGHVNNSVYMEYFDLGKVSYFSEVTGSSMDFGGTSLVIASFKVDFFEPVFLNDSIEVKTRIGSIGNKSLEMMQQVCRKGYSEPLAASVTILVCFNYSGQHSEVVPDEWREKILLFERGTCTDKKGGGNGSDIQ
jgi:acyl-CoA thioester hydrolase